MLEVVLEILLDTGLDCLKMVPFLFAAYLLIEYLEKRQSEKMQKVLSSQSKYGYLAGSVLGIIPQCGVSALAANLYSGRVITMGTLVAVFLATSDEALPVLLANPSGISSVLGLIIAKLVIAIIAGFLIDRVFNKKITEGNSGGFSGEIKDCDCHGHHKKDEGIFLAAVKHTISILFIIFLVSLAISFIVHFIGETVFSGWLSNLGIFQVFIVAIIGFIPNCAASVLLTQLYVSGGITFASAVAGLCTGAGVGLIVLFKSNKNIKENLKIMGLLYLFATIMGLILHFLSFVF